MTASPATRRPATSARQSADVGSSSSGWVGLLLGFAAASVGLIPVLGPVRPWHLFILLALAVSILTPSASRARVHPLDLALFTYVAARLVVELINSSDLHYAVNWDSLIYPIWWWLAFLAARRVATDVVRAVALLRGLTVPLLLTVPLAIGQALGIGPVLNATAQFVSSDGFQARVTNASQLRAVGLVGHWTHWGVYCAAMLTVGFILLLLARRHGVGRGTYPLIVIIAGVVGLASSITFAPAFIAAVVAAVALRRIGLNVPTFAALAAGFVAVVTFLGSGLEERIAFQATGTSKIAWLPDWVPSTISYRLYIWITETVPMIQDRPATGWGLSLYDAARFTATDPNRVYPNQLRWASAESQWLNELMASGVFVLAGLILIVGAMFKLLRGTQEPLLADVAAPLRALVLSLVIAATTAPMLTNKGAPLVLWPLLGVFLALRESQGLKAEESPPSGAASTR